MIHILVVGAGALGIRHIEALGLLGGTVKVDVVDPSPQARARAVEVAATLSPLRLAVHDSVDTLASSGDVAIIASNSRQRRAVVEKVLTAGWRNLILEKVLFPALKDYDAVAELIAKSGAATWVNCTRRTFPYAERMRLLFSGAPFSYQVEGGEWGLGCNLVHHLDEAAFLAGRTDFSIDASGLDDGALAAKREGYFEITGTIRANLPNGTRVIATARRGAAPDRSVRIDGQNVSAVVDHGGETLRLSERGREEVLDYPIPRQSVITAEHIRRILGGGAPDLPDFAAATAIHKPLIAALLPHFRKALADPELKECPIT